MSRRLYLDLDGVMADFDGSFPAVFGLDHRSLADDAMWLHINGHPSFFRDLPPIPGAVEFFRSIEHLDPIILTACPKSNYAHVATQKVEWVRTHLSAHVTVLPVLGGSSKPLFMHAKGDILIDDFRRNTEAWDAAGGTAILHRSFPNTALRLHEEIGTLMGRTSVTQDEILQLSRELFYLYDWACQHVYAEPARCTSLTAREVVDITENIHGRYEALKQDYEGLLSDHEKLLAEKASEEQKA
jgi:5'(3')-deoxyribonucleotidase